MLKYKHRMIQLLEKCSIKLDKIQCDQLWEYHNLIKKRNQKTGLTGITDFNEMILKNYVDCFIVQALIAIPFPLLDIGSGAGFPGILLKILFPDEKIILAEPRRHRSHFLNEAKDSLHLTNTYIFPKKINHNFDTKVKAVITRALEPISKTLPRISSCLETGGLAIFMKGPSVEKEIKNFNKSFGNEYSIMKNHAYTLPLINHQRRLVVLRKKAIES